MYRVEWISHVELVILELWAMADPALQARVSAAINELERRLGLDPRNEGEGRSNNVRVTFQPPLGITFTVDESAMTVRVLSAWLVKKRS